MGLNNKKHNGTVVGDFCYKDGESFRKVGSLIYYRSHDAVVRLDLIPSRMWATGETYLIANFIASEKVSEAPLIEGDVVAKTDERGARIKVGHIHSRDDAVGNAQYYIELFGLPVGGWREAIINNGESGRASIHLPVIME